MISLFISFAVLIVGYIVYGRVAEKVFAPRLPSRRETASTSCP